MLVKLFGMILMSLIYVSCGHDSGTASERECVIALELTCATKENVVVDGKPLYISASANYQAINTGMSTDGSCSKKAELPFGSVESFFCRAGINIEGISSNLDEEEVECNFDFGKFVYKRGSDKMSFLFENEPVELSCNELAPAEVSPKE